MATVGNGHVATTVYTDRVFMNGLFNGFKGESHRAIIPSRNNVRILLDDIQKSNVTNHTFALNVQQGPSSGHTFILNRYIIYYKL
jgi:hypothetical protein